MSTAEKTRRFELLSEGMLTVEEAVTMSKLSRSELYVQMRLKHLEYVQHGRRRLIPKRALMDMMNAGLVTSG